MRQAPSDVNWHELTVDWTHAVLALFGGFSPSTIISLLPWVLLSIAIFLGITPITTNRTTPTLAIVTAVSMRPLDTPLLPLLLSVGDIVIVTDDDNEGETVTELYGSDMRDSRSGFRVFLFLIPSRPRSHCLITVPHSRTCKRSKFRRCWTAEMGPEHAPSGRNDSMYYVTYVREGAERSNAHAWWLCATISL